MPEPLVLVTGVSGFIGSWVAYAALKSGYRVRGTVRSLSNEQKVHHLRELCPGSKHKIELVEADLTGDDGWAAAVKDCAYILHVASPFPLAEPKDPNELIVPAVEGTLRVLRAAAALETLPRRVIVTSSVAAMVYGQTKTDYTDDDWTDCDNKDVPIGSYLKSKTLAERAAWDFLGSLPEERRFEMATINPSFVLGPMLSTTGCSSADLMRQLVMGEIPALPETQFEIVSVYDVARAHLLAMTSPQAAGKRFMVTSGAICFRQIGALLAKEMKPLGYSCTTWHCPACLVHILACFGDQQAKSLKPSLGFKPKLSPNNARTILGLGLKEDHGIVLEMLYAALHAGVIPDKTSDKRLVKNYVRPEFDCSMLPTAVDE